MTKNTAWTIHPACNIVIVEETSATLLVTPVIYYYLGM